MSHRLDPKELNLGWEQAYQERDSDTLWQDEPIPFLAAADAELKRRGAGEVVDLGCGDGRNLAALAAAGYRATGVDVSETALAKAERRLSSRELTARYVKADAMSLPLEAASADAMTCFDVFSHIARPEDALTEVARVLRPGGLFVVNVFTTQDSECGSGELLFGHTYHYRGTMFRFYEEAEVRELFRDWKILELREERWLDPPHGEFRPYEHTHSNFLVFAVPPTPALES
ncbi:class I SAM-dependent methyltransferase [Streptomyces canus]|uniref:class I SAM-dependent methyltransferase n=1 Tax=Streptomyces canus TaxID=58343 RepID=UPI0033ABFAC0